MKPRQLLLASMLIAALPAQAAVSWTHALRTRLEAVDQDAFAHDAWAPTARLRTGLAFTAAHPDVGALVEIEGVLGLGDRYDSGANGETTRPAVTDPTGAEVNQAAVFWRAPHGSATLGRQRLQFDNQRFIGNSGWRQNEQTFDALDVSGHRGAWSWRYAYLDRVHRVAGDRARVTSAREHDLSGHALHASGAHASGTLAAYAYVVENRTQPAASSRTLGLRWSSPAERALGATAEFARQSDHANAGREFAHGYRWLEVWTRPGAVTWRAGWERLSGDGRHALQTPLATLHAFNGWADVFTTTPATGLDDRYAAAGGSWARTGSTWNLALHRFAPTLAAPRHGRELDASLARPLGRGWTALGKIAIYRADGYASDTAKLWLQLEWTR